MRGLELARIVLLCLSAFMVWEAISPARFSLSVRRPIRDWLGGFLFPGHGWIDRVPGGGDLSHGSPAVSVGEERSPIVNGALVVLDPLAVFGADRRPNGHLSGRRSCAFPWCGSHQAKGVFLIYDFLEIYGKESIGPRGTRT